jgi:uncharacterized Fe-S cluster-containing radical SAM superfamily enzyme
MDRRPRRSLKRELRELHAKLAALTLEVSALENRADNDDNVEPDPPNQPGPRVGDRVSFRIVGRGNSEGVIVSVTARRVKIRQDITNHIFERAPYNVGVLPNTTRL